METTYGQLQEAVDVVVDETVSKGETIGYVAEPTWYSLALGNHVEFQVTLDGTPVDPTLYLGKHFRRMRKIRWSPLLFGCRILFFSLKAIGRSVLK